MPHHDSLVAIAIVGLAALLCGMAMTRLRQPALVGYILAGVILGPSAAGLVVDRDLISLFAEIGVLMLLFLIGMELPLANFIKGASDLIACVRCIDLIQSHMGGHHAPADIFECRL